MTILDIIGIGLTAFLVVGFSAAVVDLWFVLRRHNKENKDGSK